VPDQIGFGKSSKLDIHYSFHALALSTKKLLDSLGIARVAVVGHSMGGMLAVRFTLLYPETVTHLIVENPIGLEDYRDFVPYAPIEDLYADELKMTEEAIRNYHKAYYAEWKLEYEEYVQVFIRWRLSGEFPRLAMTSALTSQMIYEEPVCYELPRIKAKTLLIIGQADRTVVGKARVKKDILPFVGQFPELGRRAARMIPNSSLVEIDNVGHVPHLEAPERFHREVVLFLNE
jgi:pimeloyl-ACP methyl ester carboxylesterase